MEGLSHPLLFRSVRGALTLAGQAAQRRDGAESPTTALGWAAARMGGHLLPCHPSEWRVLLAAEPSWFQSVMGEAGYIWGQAWPHSVGYIQWPGLASTPGPIVPAENPGLVGYAIQTLGLGAGGWKEAKSVILGWSLPS